MLFLDTQHTVFKELHCSGIFQKFLLGTISNIVSLVLSINCYMILYAW